MSDTFLYDNRKFNVEVALVDNEVGGGGQVLLHQENIGTIQYTNEINDFVVKGTIEYTDTDAKVDTYLDKFYVQCSVTLRELEDKTSGKITIAKEKRTMSVVFDVVNIGILENQKGRIKYLIYLATPTWKKCLSRIHYTNYGKAKENVLDIVQNLLKLAEFNFDKASFDKIGSVVRLNYITDNNDNIVTSTRYLFNKMFYSGEYGTDQSIKCLVYDQNADIVRGFDTEVVNDYQKTFPVTVSQTETDINPVTNRGINLAYDVKQDKMQIAETALANNRYFYSLDTNEFGSETFSSQQIMNYYHGHNKNPRFSSLPSDIWYSRYQTDWNNNTNVYWDQLKNLEHYGCLILNMPGQIGAIPGWLISVTIPVEPELVSGQNKEHQEQILRQYQSMAGTWIAGAVTTFINPQKMVFRQNIKLMRNTRALADH